MKNRLLLLLSLFTGATAFSQGTVILLSVTQVAQKLREAPGAVVIDLRTPAAFSQSHLPGARNLPENELANALISVDTAQTVLVYDEDGSRTAAATENLRAAGFSHLMALQGGFRQWTLARLPLETPRPAKLENLSAADFGNLVKSDKTVVIDIYADWCGPCRAMMPNLEKVEKELEGRIEVIRINADANPDLMAGLQIKALPTLLVYKEQKLQKFRVGYLTKGEIMKLVK